MAFRGVEDTFTGTGASGAVKCTRALISLEFAGTATVQLQQNIGTDESPDWFDVPDGEFTASTSKVFDPGGATVTLRLNCSAYTNDVIYKLQAGTRD